MDDYDYEEMGIDNSRPPKLSKSAKKANLRRAVPHYDEVNVLVTGFGVSHDLIPTPISYPGYLHRKSHH
jgi:hypothetical protein